jgi:hypothetical protein
MAKRKNTTILRGIAVLLVLLSFLMYVDAMSIPALNDYVYWMVVLAFGIVLLSTR